MERKLTHFFQETGYTCACAVARMLLHTKGIDLSELEIEFEMKVVEGKGASTWTLTKFLEKHDFTVTLFQDSSIDEMIDASGIKLLLFSIDGEIPHVAIIKAISESGVHLFDPSEGKSFMSIQKMKDVWFTDENKKSWIQIS